MNFVESNGSKIAAVLCVASCIPVVATIYASGTQPGTEGDKLVNGDAKVAKGWQEIEGKSWFFKENKASVAQEVEAAPVAKVSTTISDDVSDSVIGTTKQYVNEINAEQEAAAQEAVVEEVLFEQEAPVQNQVETFIPVEYVEETPAEEVVYFEEDEEVVVEDEAEYFEEEYVEEAYDEAEEEYVENAFEEDGDAEEVYFEEDEYVEDTYEEEYVEVPEVADPVYEEDTYTATSTGQAIADAAMGLIGITDGWQCTEVATQALINAGVEGVPVCWPDQYQNYGTVSYEASVGSLAYYYNGGPGADHIAVYVGDGMCVHGNFDGQTIYYSETTGSGSPDYYVVFE